MNTPDHPTPEEIAAARASLERTANSQNPASKIGGRYYRWLYDVADAKAKLAALDRGEWPFIRDEEIPF